MELCPQNATDTTNCFIENPKDYVVVPLPKWVLPLKLSYMLFIIVVGVTGNGLIILVQLKNRRKSSTDCFVLSMATSDAVLAGVVGSIHVMECLPTVWIAVVSDSLCKLFSYFIYCTTLASTQLLSAIAFDRFRLTCRPHSRILDTRKAALVCGFIAIDSLVVCSLTPALFRVNEAGDKCTRVDNRMIEATIFDTTLAASFIAMFVVVIVCYSNVAHALRRHHKAKAQQQSTTGSEVDSTKVSGPKQVLKKKFRCHRVGAIDIDVGNKSDTSQPNTHQANNNFPKPEDTINADNVGIAHGRQNEILASTSTPLEGNNIMVVSEKIETVRFYAGSRAKDNLLLTNTNEVLVLTEANDNLRPTKANDNPMSPNANDNPQSTNADDNPRSTNANGNPRSTNAYNNPMTTNANDSSRSTNANHNPRSTNANDNPRSTNAYNNPMTTNAYDTSMTTNANHNPRSTNANHNPRSTHAHDNPRATNANDNRKANKSPVATNSNDNPTSTATNADDNPMLTRQRIVAKKITEESTRINRTTVLMSLITAVYTLSWLAYFGIDTYLSIGDHRGSTEGRVLMTMSGTLYMVNSIANPVFYILLSSVFRSRVMDTLPCCRSVG